MTSIKQPVALPRIVKLAYGAGDLGPAIVASITGFFLNVFLIEVAGLRPAAAGLIFLIVKIWDGVNDPLIGTLTDKTRTRWGRRRPWLLFGAVPFALAYLLHWYVPDISLAAKFWYYLVVAILLDTGFTAVNLPYTALTPQIAPTYDQRTSLNSYRFAFSILGGVLGVFLHTIIVQSATERGAIASGYLISAAAVAAIIVVSNIITFTFVSEPDSRTTEAAPTVKLIDGLKIAFGNRPFVLVTIIYLLSWLSVQFVQNNLFLYVKYWIGAEGQFQWLILVLQGFSFLFLLMWTRLSARIGKKRVYTLGILGWLAASFLLFFVPQGGVVLLYPLAILAALGVSVSLLIPWSMLPDVVELDELQTGQRREGIFYGFFVFFQKLGISLGLALSGFILDWTGYIRPEYSGGPSAPAQPDAVLLALRSFVGLAPIAILLVSLVANHYYPITRERHNEIRRQLNDFRE